MGDGEYRHGPFSFFSTHVKDKTGVYNLLREMGRTTHRLSTNHDMRRRVLFAISELYTVCSGHQNKNH